MKRKIIKKLLFSFILIAVFIINPIVYAEKENNNYTTDYIKINESSNLNAGKLSFSNLKFIDNSKSSTLSFGITGNVKNTTNGEISYNAKAYFYDKDYKLIATTIVKTISMVDSNTLNLMDNLSKLNGKSITDIQYYKFAIEITGSSNVVSIIPSNTEKYSDYDYVIDKYDIDIKVNENNTFDITENITTFFNIPKHGIYRNIPLKNEIIRLDGTKTKNRARVTNVDVNDNYSTSKLNGNYEIKIGSADTTLTGKQSYTIKYTYNIGKDPIENYDELYFNIIGTEWDTVIGNITFTITMPKEFDSTKLGFSSGKYESNSNDKIVYNIIGNKIEGYYNGILEEYEGITLRAELEEGYFVGAGFNESKLAVLTIIIPIVFAASAYYLWNKYGRDDQVVETVEFYPPKGFNSVDVAFNYRGKVGNKDVTSLLIYLANKGYIKISDIEEKKIFGKHKSFKITKLKEYDGDDENEKLFLSGLFSKKSSIKSLFKSEEQNNSLAEVTESDLQNHFYITMNKIISRTNTNSNKNKIFDKTASSKKLIVILMIIVTICLITIPPFIDSGDTDLIPIGLIFPGIGFSVMSAMIFGNQSGDSKIGNIFTKIFGIVWGFGFGGIPFLLVVLPILLDFRIYLIGYLTGIVCIIIMVVCIIYLSKRTPYGNEILGKIKGFKNFLITAEKDKLEAMVMENPTYFYDILPFTYVLGISDKWIRKFESISIEPPSWYDSPNAFDMVYFGSFMNSTMTSAQSVMSSSPSDSSSSFGGSSGGGFSGGGSGGGGGGSW